MKKLYSIFGEFGNIATEDERLAYRIGKGRGEYGADVYPTTITLLENEQELNTFINNVRRERALSKLTVDDKKILGLL